MLPVKRGEKYYTNFIGKYYKRIVSYPYYCVFQINSYADGFFRVTEYFLMLGCSTKEENLQLNCSIIENSSFVEITKEEYNNIKFLCCHPLTTVY